MMADFTQKKYRNLLLSLMEQGYQFQTFQEYLTTPASRSIVLRHDVDRRPNNSLDLARIENELGIKPGQITRDRKFSLEVVNCIGACDQAPAMLINQDVHGNLTPKKISRILKAY